MGRTLRTQNLKLALRADSGLGIGMIYPLTNKRNILGRSVDVEVPVEDSKVSRHHASIDLQNGFYILVDLGSTNGTFLNGKKLATGKRVTIGDRVRVGSAVYVVELLDQAKAGLSKHWRESTHIGVIHENQHLSFLEAEDEVAIDNTSVDKPGESKKSPNKKAPAKKMPKAKAKIANAANDTQDDDVVEEVKVAQEDSSVRIAFPAARPAPRTPEWMRALPGQFRRAVGPSPVRRWLTPHKQVQMRMAVASVMALAIIAAAILV